MTQTLTVERKQTGTDLMRAAVVVAPRMIEIRSVPVPEPAAGQVRVRIQGCGVCASNIPPWEGREWFHYPLAPGQLGHEAWGCVDAVGEGVTHLHPGDRVAMLSEHAYAQYDLGGVEQVVTLPDALQGVPFPAEPLGCAINILARSGVKAEHTVAIVGIGFLGAILTRMIRNTGARVIAISRRPCSLDIAKRMGASEVIAMEDHWQIINQVRQLTQGRGCDVVIEAAGKQWPLDLAGELTCERGRLVIAGYHQDGLRTVNMQLWNWRGLDVINAHERDGRMYLQGMQEAVRQVVSGKLDPMPLYTHRYSLEQLGEALDATRERPAGFMKALVMM